ncbi:MAG: hypothetical protein OQJ93_08795 [Ignavibacteriaceae bacterium]|jgi:hypothetical protein|nr:hypothetical protein [Ignavibacteriaceae bacterium]
MKLGYKFIILTLFSLLVLIPFNFAQEKLKDKINKINGSVDKIVVTADGKDYSFEGNEAQELFNKMKKNTSHNFTWTTSDSDSGKEKVIIVNSDGDDKVIEIESAGRNNIIIKTDKDIDDDINGIKKKVKIEVENENKKVTVTTTKNGEKKTEVYKGIEADEYIEKMKSENEDFNISIDKDNDGKKVKKIIIETEKEEKNK